MLFLLDMSTIFPGRRASPRRFRFDVVVIGAGPAGVLAATVAYREGARVAMVCDTEGQPTPSSLPEEVVLLRGPASFLSPSTLRVSEHSIDASSFVIATGSVARRPTLPGLPSERACTADELPRRQPLPRRIAVFGATESGLELAQTCAREGARVTVLDTTTTLLEDTPICNELLSRALRREFDICLGAHICGAEVSASGVDLHMSRPTPDCALSVDQVVFALGRVPRVDQLALERAAVDRFAGVLLIDRFRRTSNPRVLVAGDDTGHIDGLHGFEQASEVAGFNAAHASEPKPFSPPLPMTLIMTAPGYARVGEAEPAARRRVGQMFTASRVYTSARPSPSTGSSCPVCTDDTVEGLVRMWSDLDGNVLGGEAIGPSADLLIHLIAHTMEDGGNLASVSAFACPPKGVAHAFALLRDALLSASRKRGPLNRHASTERSDTAQASPGRDSVTVPASG